MTLLRAAVRCAAPAHVSGAQAARANVQGFCAADTGHLLQSVLHVSPIFQDSSDVMDRLRFCTAAFQMPGHPGRHYAQRAYLHSVAR